MDCRTILDILTTLGSTAIDNDSSARAHVDKCSSCAEHYKAEQELDAMLAADMPGMPSSSEAMSRIMASISGPQVSDSMVLSYLDGSLEGEDLEFYEKQRETNPACQSLEASHREVWEMLEHGFPAPLPYDQAAVDRCQEAIFGVKQSAPKPALQNVQSPGPLSIGPRPPMTFYYAAAAALLVALSLGALFFKQAEQNDVAENVPRVKDVIKDKGSKEKSFAPLREVLKKETPKPQSPESKKDDPKKPDPLKERSPKVETPKKPEPKPTPKMDFAKKDPAKPPVKTNPEKPASSALLASLSKEDRELVLNLDVLEKMDEAENHDLMMDSDLLSAMTLEDFEEN